MIDRFDSFVTDRLPPEAAQPEFLFEIPDVRYPERLNAASVLLESGHRDDLAIINDSIEWTYAQLNEMSGRIARLLIEEGIIPGNRVLINGPNSAYLFACWLGIIKAGGVVVAANPLLRSAELSSILSIAKISYALVDSSCADVLKKILHERAHDFGMIEFAGDSSSGALYERIRHIDKPAVPVETHRDDPAILAFTSGTTGQPKACVQFHRDILACADTFARHILKPERGWRWSCTAPLAFTFGLGMQFVFPLRFGGTAVTVGKSGPDGLLETIEKFQVNVCATAPTGYQAMLDQVGVFDISTLCCCVSAGEHLPGVVWHKWMDATGLSLIDGIGATEMMHIFISAGAESLRPGATGKAVTGYKAAVLDERNEPLNSGIGRLAVKGPTGCRYLDDERQSDYVINGWNVTGDTYRLDEDGYFWFVARSDDMIISSGYNIAAPEVEEALLSHESVAECAVIGVPDEKRGNTVKAFICLRDGQEGSSELVKILQDHVKDRIAPYKYPRQISFVDELPKTVTGKLKRSALRQGD